MTSIKAESADKPLILTFFMTEHSSSGGITRQELKEMADVMGADETKVIHIALNRMYRELFGSDEEMTEEEFLSLNVPLPADSIIIRSENLLDILKEKMEAQK
jgi:hypothetical protein